MEKGAVGSAALVKEEAKEAGDVVVEAVVMVEGVVVAVGAAMAALAEEARIAMSCQQTECLIQPPQRPPRSSRQTLRRCTRYLKKRRTALHCELASP